MLSKFYQADPDLHEDDVLEEMTQAVTGAAIRLASRDLAKRRESDPTLASILMMHANSSIPHPHVTAQHQIRNVVACTLNPTLTQSRQTG